MKKPFFRTPVISYEINRPLNDYERQYQLPQKHRSSCPPRAQFSVIKMNSTFLECPDKHYANKGAFAGPGLCCLGLALFMMCFFPILVIMEWPTIPDDDRGMALFGAIFAFIVGGLLSWLFFSLFKKEIFRYTHYPMRFNRKTRKVHFFRDDGTILTEAWDKLFFYLAPAQWGNYEVSCHHLSEDRQTVLDTFALQLDADRDEPFLLSQWEFIRRFMEEPEQLPHLAGQVDLVMDIGEKRESFWHGFQRLLYEVSGPLTLLAIIMSPLIFLSAIGRWIVMRSCVVPVWPAEIEAECQIEPDDPYIRDRDHLADPDTVELLPAGSIAGRLRERRRQRMQK